ncbi:rho GTPase-activating protein 28 isoform X1 [Osmerus mordax]|uniref:rho GTPase-activating protein 28 isoform X1 n=2 Tax=Osmerus mordax TaxID=8014 RepID=UPI00350F64F2
MCKMLLWRSTAMELTDSGGVTLTGYHSYDPSIHVAEDIYASPVSPASFSRKVQYQGPGRMMTPRASPPTPPLTADPMDDYWSEVKSIEEGEEASGGDQDLLERASMDEAELEEAWLTEAGLEGLVSGAQEEGPEGPVEVLLSTLTRSQAAMVKRRVDNYTQTLRKRNRQNTRHVRDVFSTPDPPPVEPVPHVSPNSPNGHSPSDQHTPSLRHTPSNRHTPFRGRPPSNRHAPSNEQTTAHGRTQTKTIHRTPSRVRPACPSFSPVEAVSERPGPPDQQGELLCDVPYSEGVLPHLRGGACHDCQRLRKDDPNLQPFQLARPRLGLTCVQDLSCQDMKKVGYIALIEITTFYHAMGIELKRYRAARSKARESGIFGVPLTTLLESDRKKVPGSKVPLVFRKLLSKLEQTGLQTEGILRVPGSASRVKHLRQELESKFYEDRFDWDQVRHNDAAGLLKMFIRELPCPLLTLQHLPAFTAVQDISSPLHQVQALHLLTMLLPEANRDTLKALLEFLRKVVECEQQNRMSLWNVSMIVAPNLVTCKGHSPRPEDMEGAAGAAALVRLLITHQDLLWTVPSFLLSQVRKMNEASDRRKQPGSEKSKRRLLPLRRRTTERDKTPRSEVTDLHEGVIRVYAPLHTKVSMAILLDSETKAKDVMARFDCENGHGTRRSRACLFEVGGNIGERCLDPETHLQEVYQVNPTCEWVLKPSPDTPEGV